MRAECSNGLKAKTARRIIEVLEFFDEQHKEATVMDIVRRFNRPQSSTSELLSTLVELGLLYKDCNSRKYSLSPRAAILGTAVQPEFIRHGTLAKAIDKLTAQLDLSIAVFGIVSTNTQIFSWTPGSNKWMVPPELLRNGAQERLCDSAAGLLLLSTVEQTRRAGILRRLNAEADDNRKFQPAQVSIQIQEAGLRGAAVGPVGFGSIAEVAAILLPVRDPTRQIALGFVYGRDRGVDPNALITALRTAVGMTDDVRTGYSNELRDMMRHAA